MSGKVLTQIPIDCNSGHILLSCEEGSLYAQFVIGYVLGASADTDRYTIDFLFQERKAREKNGFPESIKTRVCFAQWSDVEYWIKNVPHQIVPFLFVKNEFDMEYIDINTELMEKVESCINYFVGEISDIQSHLEEIRTNPLYIEKINKNELQ